MMMAVHALSPFERWGAISRFDENYTRSAVKMVTKATILIGR